MAVVARKRRNGVVYFVATRWKGVIYWERSGTEKREADRLSERRKREVKAGTFQPPALRSSHLPVSRHLTEWAKARTTRSARSGLEGYYVGYFTKAEWFSSMPLEDVRPRHVIQLTKDLQAERAAKTVTSTISLLGVFFRDMVIAETIAASPVVLPKGLLRRTFKRTEPYEADEVARLLALPGIHGLLAHLAFYSGMRPGEIAGRRFRDILDARPLTAISVHSQYKDEPLKTDDGDMARPRLVPIHPELARKLDEWRTSGFALTYASANPGPDDWILPTRRRSRDRTEPYGKSGLYQLWRQACVMAGVKGRELRATRNTFVTFARRSSPRTDVIESFTHNAAGSMIDRYNRFQWAPRCEVMQALVFDVSFDEVAPRLVSGLQRLDSNQGPGG
jgi:integrase